MSTGVETSTGSRPSEGLPVGASRLRYVEALDGLRAVAVLAVMAYHLGPGGLPGGFLGVDTFFVLSGFLITTLLLQEHRRRGRIDLAQFWGRRARRLFPGLFAMLAVVSLGSFFASALEQVTIRGQGIATLLYVNNWWIIASGDSYFAQFRAPSPLLHTWSLGVEEQWYLLFPVALAGALAWRLRRTRALVLVLAALASASALWTALLALGGATPDRLYLGTDTRAQELLVGAALAAAVHVAAAEGRFILGWGPRARLALSLVLGGALLACFVLVHDTDSGLFLGGMLAFSLLVAGVLVLVVHPEGSPLGSLLSWRPLVAVGVISYSLYLWHWPIYVLLRPDVTGWDGPGLALLRVGLSFAAAIASYRWLEAPVRRGALKRIFGSQGQVGVAVAAAAVLAVAVMVSTQAGVAALGDPGRYRESGVSYDGTGPRLFLVGDSVPMGLRERLDDATREQFSVGGSSIFTCTLFPATFVFGDSEEQPSQECFDWESSRGSLFQQAAPDVAMIWPGMYQMFDIKIDGEVVPFGSQGYRDWLVSRMDELRSQFGAAAKHLALVTVPCHRVPEAGNATKAIIVNDDARVDWLNSMMVEYAKRHDMAVFDLHDFSCGDGRDPEVVDGVQMRMDGMHYSTEGAAVIWSWLREQSADLLATPPRPATS